MPPREDDVDEDLRWSVEAHLEFLASAPATLDFADGRQAAAAEAYVAQLLAVEQHCDSITLSSASHAATIVELAVDAVSKLKNLPTLAAEAWCRLASTALANRLSSGNDSDAIQVILPKLVSQLADTIKSLSKDRFDAAVSTSCALDGALRLLTAMLRVLINLVGISVGVSALIDACLIAASTAGNAVPILSSAQLPHPTKTIAQAPRVSALAVVPLLVEGSARRGGHSNRSLPASAALQTPATSILVRASRRRPDTPLWLPSAGSTSVTHVLHSEWTAYLRKGVEGKDVAVKEASLQCLADCLFVAVLPESQLSWVMDVIGRIADATGTTSKMISSSARSLGAILAYVAVGSSHATPPQALASSSWALWRGSGGSVQDSTPISGDAWSLFRSFLRPPMTRAMQAMLGEALGTFLALCSNARPHWYSSAVDQVMALALPANSGPTAPSGGKAPGGGGDTRAYVPKIITRAVAVWCGVAAANDTHRQAVIGSFMAYIKADLPKQISQTALTCLSLILSAVRSLRSEISGTLFALTKVLCISMTPVATAAADVCARVAALDINALYAVMRMQTDLIEDVTRSEPITHALMGVSKILTSLPKETLVQHAPAVLEVFMTSLCSLGTVSQYQQQCSSVPHVNNGVMAAPSPAISAASSKRQDLEEVWRSEPLARRIEQAHAFAHTLLITGVAQQKPLDQSVMTLTPAVVRHIQQLCGEHLQALIDAATQECGMPTSPKTSAEGVAAPQPRAGTTPPSAPWLRASFSVATTVRLLGERGDHQQQTVAIWFSFLRVIAQTPQDSITGPAGAFLVKLKREVWHNFSHGVHLLRDDPLAALPFKKARQMIQRAISAALDEVDIAVKGQCPVFCSDTSLFPQSTSAFMASCRRAAPLSHQLAASQSLAAATEFLSTVFASPLVSTASLRAEVIRSLFDVLLKPIAADGGTIARWNIAFVLQQCLMKDFQCDDAGKSLDRPPENLWQTDKALQNVAVTLRAQLLSDQFCGVTTTAAAAAPSILPPVFDIQIVAARALAHLSALVDDVGAFVSRVALDQGRVTGSAVNAGPTGVDASRAAVGSLLLLSECSSLFKKQGERATSDDTEHLLPLVTSHMNVLLSRMTNGAPTGTSAAIAVGPTSGLFGDPCSPVAIAIGLAVAKLAENHGMTVLREVFPAQLQSTLLLRPSLLVVDSLVQALLWAALCNAERCCIGQSKNLSSSEDDAWSAQNCGGRPASLLARHSWEAAALCASSTDSDTLQASVALLAECLSGTRSSLDEVTGTPARRRKVGGPMLNSLHLLKCLLGVQGHRLHIPQHNNNDSASNCSAESVLSLSSLVAECVGHLLAIEHSQRRSSKLLPMETSSELRIAVARVDSSLTSMEVATWQSIGQRSMFNACAVSELQTVRLFKQVLLALVTAKPVPLPKHAALDDRDDVASARHALDAASRKSDDYGEDVERGAGNVAAPRSGTSLDDEASCDTKGKEVVVEWASQLLSVNVATLSHVAVFPPSESSVDDIVKFASVSAALAETTPLLCCAARRLFTSVLSKYFLDPSKRHFPWVAGRKTQTHHVAVVSDFDDFFASAPTQPAFSLDHMITSYRTQMASAVRQLVRCVSASCKVSGVDDVINLSAAFFSSLLCDHVTNSRVLEAMLARICAIEDGHSVHCGEETIPLLSHAFHSIALLTANEPPTALSAAPSTKVVKPYSSSLRDALHTHAGIQHALHRVAITILSRLGTEELPSRKRRHCAEPACQYSAASYATAKLLFGVLHVGCNPVLTSDSGGTAQGSWIGPTLRQSAGAAACGMLARPTHELLADSGNVAFQSTWFCHIIDLGSCFQRFHRDKIELLTICHTVQLSQELATSSPPHPAVKSVDYGLALPTLLRRSLLHFEEWMAASPDGELSTFPSSELRAALANCARLEESHEVQWILCSRASSSIVSRLALGTLVATRSPVWVLRCRQLVGAPQFEDDFDKWLTSDTVSSHNPIRELFHKHPMSKQQAVEMGVKVLHTILVESHSADEAISLLSSLKCILENSMARPKIALLVAACALMKSNDANRGQLIMLADFSWSILVDAIDAATDDQSHSVVREWVDVVLPCVATVAEQHAPQDMKDRLSNLLRSRIAQHEALRDQARNLPAAAKETLRELLAAAQPWHASTPQVTQPAAGKRTRLTINVNSFQ